MHELLRPGDRVRPSSFEARTVHSPFPIAWRVRAAIATAALLPCLATAAPIYECLDSETGKRTFTHHGCPDPGHGRTRYVPGQHSNFAMEPMSAADRARLADVTPLSRGRAGQRRSETLMEARAQCREARAMLKALRAERRAGYALKDAKRLDSDERAAKAMRRKHC